MYLFTQVVYTYIHMHVFASYKLPLFFAPFSATFYDDCCNKMTSLFKCVIMSMCQ